MESILTSIKKMLGLDADYEAFDIDVIALINSALMALQQLGVGPEKGFFILGKEETWDQFLNGRTDLEAVKTYVYIKTKIAFDPPSNSFTLDALNKMAAEYEWRININAEGGNKDDT